jgi:CubicO group peptidase (beta-lactamase class C family)
MRHTAGIIALALSGSVGFAVGEQCQPPKEYGVAAIDAYIGCYAKDRGIPGLSVAIVRDGKVALERGYGKASIAAAAPVTPQTLFAVGSVTKQFTSACILLLAGEGKLSISDPVSKYLPGLTRAGDITLLDLMNHVSGYPDFYPLDFVDRRLVAPIAADELARRYATGALDFEPGARYSYSNTGFIILGLVVEKVSGQPFGPFLQERILTPLGMTHSAFEPKESGPGFATGYTSFGLAPWEPAVYEARGWMGAAGALWASPSDLARWDIALMTGRVLAPEQYALMTTPRRLGEGRTTAYGCGLDVTEPRGTTVLSHGGAVSGFLAENTMIPATRSALVLLTNCEDSTSLSKLNDALLTLLMPPAQPVPRVAGPPAAEVAEELFAQLQAGRVDRARLGEEFGIYLTPKRVRDASGQLKRWGQPKSVEVVRMSERGGMETARLRMVFKSGALRVLMRRTPDGLVQELLVERE